MEAFCGAPAEGHRALIAHLRNHKNLISSIVFQLKYKKSTI
jgi:hypothetical protein